MISASRKSSQTQFIHVESTVGGQCRIQADLCEPLHVDGAGAWDYLDGILVFDTNSGGQYCIWSGTQRPEPEIAPAQDRPWEHHYYGAKSSPRY